MVDLGVLGITIPEEYGGFASPGESMTYAMIAVHELARAELSMSLPVHVLLNIGWAYLLALHGGEEVKQEVLPRVAKGEWFLGICTTEPGGGSDLANIKTTAVKKGDKWVVNGEKAYISGVEEAANKGGGHLTLLRTDDPAKGNKGLSFAYVPTQAPGVSWTKYRDMGRMGLSTGGLVFKDVEIPEHYILQGVNKGFYVAMEGFNAARILVAAACLGAAEKAIELGTEYTKQRVLFGQPIVQNQSIAFEIADDVAMLELLKLGLQRAAWMTDTFYSEPGSFTRKELNLNVAIAKAKCPIFAIEAIRHSMMYHGAFSYTKDTPLEMALRGVYSYVVGAEGGINIMKMIIARDYIGDIAVSHKNK